ncbi:MAG: hypothetical protein PUC97_06500 [bacterium]|nr:hypothetical protein [bacterium]
MGKTKGTNSFMEVILTNCCFSVSFSTNHSKTKERIAENEKADFIPFGCAVPAWELPGNVCGGSGNA